MAKTEAELEDFFMKRVKLLGGHSVKLAPMQAGIPDRLVIFPGGRFYFVELKTLTGQVSPIQKVWHERMLERWNVRVWVLFGEDQIVSWLRAVMSYGDPAPRKPGPKPALTAAK